MKISMLKTKIGACALAVVASMAIAVPTAFAAVVDDTVSDSEATAIPTQEQAASGVTVAASRAAMPAPELLGLSGVEESGQFITMYNSVPVFSWNPYPKYMLIGSSFSTRINPYLTNYAIGQGTTGVNVGVYNPSRSGGGNGPNAVLGAYGADSSDDAVWDLQPGIILGNNGLSDSDLLDLYTNYSTVNVPTAYAPRGVEYQYTHLGYMETTMDNLAAAAVAVDPDSDAQDYADAYTDYIEDNIAAINASGVVVAYINGYSNGVFSIGTNGTGYTNRYLEVAMAAGATDYYTMRTSATAAQLASEVDMIIIGGQTNAGSYTDIMNGIWNDDADLLNIAYFTKDNGSYGAMYGLVMNSVDNAQNVGRIAQGLNPSMSSRGLVGEYYEMFYHVDPTYTTPIINKTMDGVRNWDATIDFSTYQGSLSDAIDDLTEW